MGHILVAEDDPKQAELVRRYAVVEGHEVTVVHDGGNALAAVRRRMPDLVVLDVMMPGVDGHDVCRVLRAEPATASVPILMLTARATEEDLVRGLDLGADDYLTKPYSPRELIARVRTLLRRQARSAPPPPTLVVGSLVVSPGTREVHLDGRPVSCTVGEFVLIEALAAEPGRVFERNQLLARLHGPHGEGHVTPRTVDVHVANLRRKLRPDLIRTVYGVGYALEPPTELRPEPAADGP